MLPLPLPALLLLELQTKVPEDYAKISHTEKAPTDVYLLWFNLILILIDS